MKLKQNIGGLLIATTFFLVGLLTLPHYGLNIDEPIHFIRGQAYLNLFLTGKTVYSSSEMTKVRVSAWKIQKYNAAYFMENDSGHPPLNGILAAATNKIFYETIGILGDLESYHLFEIIISTMLILLIYIIVNYVFGFLAGVIATLSLALYPLFWGESHFNIKDPVETSFFAYALCLFYLGIDRGRARYFLLSAIFSGLAFATKFNIVFAPFILIPYLIFCLLPKIKGSGITFLKKIPAKVYLSLLIYPLIVLGIHLVSRPYLWTNTLPRFLEIVSYYKSIGTGTFYQKNYLINGWNFYAPVFIFASTPPIILFLSLLGGLGSLFWLHNKQKTFVWLAFWWLIVSIVRVMLPWSSIYSGVRQIMEYLPPLAIFAGIGAHFIYYKILKQSKYKILTLFGIASAYFFLLNQLITLHPNENVYISPLIGGLASAVERKLPGAGETMGNVYLQGIWWLNQNAPPGAKVGLPVGLLSNLPRIHIRPDIQSGAYFSGMKRAGEYMMEMISVDFPPPRYNFLYLNRFLEPVYTVKVDGVPLLKIWKNDLEHTRQNFREEITIPIDKISGGMADNFLKIEFKNAITLTRLVIDYYPVNCDFRMGGDISFGIDEETVYHAPDDLFNMQGPYATSLQMPGRFVYFFPAFQAKWLQITPTDEGLCLLNYKNIQVMGLP